MEAKLKTTSRWHNKDKSKQQDNESRVKDDDVMISTSIKDLEAMMEGMETHTKTTFEKMFLPSITVFALLAFGGFLIIYSITQDMTRLADSMDPKMATNMNQISESIIKVSESVALMGKSVDNMNKNFVEVNQKMGKVVAKLDNLDSISKDISAVKIEMETLKPMLSNMNHMNKSMINMNKSMEKMNYDINALRNSFQGPMNKINSIPFM